MSSCQNEINNNDCVNSNFSLLFGLTQQVFGLVSNLSSNIFNYFATNTAQLNLIQDTLNKILAVSTATATPFLVYTGSDFTLNSGTNSVPNNHFYGTGVIPTCPSTVTLTVYAKNDYSLPRGTVTICSDGVNYNITPVTLPTPFTLVSGNGITTSPPPTPTSI